MWNASMFCQHHPGFAWLESADAIHPPGATMSGLIRPSAVGPRLLKPIEALKSSAGQVPGGGTVGRKFNESPVVITFVEFPGLRGRRWAGGPPSCAPLPAQTQKLG